MSEYIKKEDAIEAVTSIFRMSALFSGMSDNEEKWREKAEKVLAKCEVVTDIADTPQTNRTIGTTIEPLTEQPQTEDYDFRDEQEYNDRWDCPWK